MSLLLPTWPAPKEIIDRLFVAGDIQSTATGSDDAWLDRLGSRFIVDFTMKPMTPEQAAEWSDLDEKGANVVMTLRQPGLDTGAPGAAVVDSSGQSGSSIAVKGLTPHYVMRRRQWLSVISEGQRYAYRARSEAVADDVGNILVPVRPMLRFAHANNDVVEIAEPKIEGIATLSDDAWRIRADDRLVYLSFSIKERA